jgi:predicted ATP-grasp superfamily ATP-dependent carboligase
MDTSKISQEISKALIHIWDEMENSEELYKCTEDGVEFNFIKCMEKRVICLGSSIMASVQCSDSRLTKVILLDAFVKALVSIQENAKDSKVLADRRNMAIHNAGISTLQDIALQLKEELQ